MSTSFSLDQLTEGIRQRHLGTQNKQLVEKWSRTGLLRGLNGVHRENMARILENQAGQVLKEASSVSTGGGNLNSSGDLRGFTNIAFPIVRRVFGGLISNELVSIQPMSLPSGLLFYLDYNYGTPQGANNQSGGAAYNTGSSIYGSPDGKDVQKGADAVGGLYDLAGQGYSRVYKNHPVVTGLSFLASGSVRSTSSQAIVPATLAQATGSDAKLLQFDPQLINAIESNNLGAGAAGDAAYSFVVVRASDLSNLDETLVKEVTLLNQSTTADATLKFIGNDTNGNKIQTEQTFLMFAD